MASHKIQLLIPWQTLTILGVKFPELQQKLRQMKIMMRCKSPKDLKLKRIQFISLPWKKEMALIEGHFHGHGEWVAAAIMFQSLSFLIGKLEIIKWIFQG